MNFIMYNCVIDRKKYAPSKVILTHCVLVIDTPQNFASTLQRIKRGELVVYQVNDALQSAMMKARLRRSTTFKVI